MNLRVFALRTLVEWERSEAHARGGCDGRQKGCERGYYDLHRYLNDAFLHHLFTFLPFYFFTFKLSLSGLLLQDPVIKRSDLLDVLLLGGILLLRSEVNFLLYAVSGERTLVLERTRGDVVVVRALGTESDVNTLHIGVRVPLAVEDIGLGDACLGGLYRGPEDAQTVDLDGVTLGDQLDHAGGHLREHTLDDVATVDALVLSHVLGQTSERDRLLESLF